VDALIYLTEEAFVSGDTRSDRHRYQYCDDVGPSPLPRWNQGVWGPGPRPVSAPRALSQHPARARPVEEGEVRAQAL
jgi:hypothetical protein